MENEYRRFFLGWRPVTEEERAKADEVAKKEKPRYAVSLKIGEITNEEGCTVTVYI